MKENIFRFYEPMPVSCFRSSLLMGDNDKCCKFALGMRMLYFAKQKKNEISINELFSIYINFICEHIKKVSIQGITREPPRRILIACNKSRIIDQGFIHKKKLKILN